MSRLLRSLLAILFLVVFSLEAPAQFAWEPVDGPYGYVTFRLLATDSAGGVWGSTSYGLYRSRDGGESWEAKIQNFNGNAVEVSPSGRVFAVDRKGNVVSSIDGGESWTISGRPVSGDSYHQGFLAVSDSLLYVTGRESSSARIYRSTDAGASWEQPRGSQYPIDIHLVSSRAFLVQQRYLSYFDPNDSALTLTQVRDISPESNMVEGEGGTLYIADGSAIYSSNDTGLTWTPLPANFGAYSLIYSEPQTLTAVSSFGLFVSKDAGQTWSQASTERFVAGTGIVTHEGSLLASNYRSVYRSIDDGDTWNQSVQGITGVPLYSMATGEGEVVLLGTISEGILTIDTKTGVSSSFVDSVWNEEDSRTDALRAGRVIERSPKGVLFAGTNVGLYKSSDVGTSWERITPGSQNVVSVAVASSELLLIKSGSSSGSELYRTLDGGATWDSIRLNRAVSEVYHNPVSNRFYAIAISSGSTKYLYCSADSGETWVEQTSTTALRNFEIDLRTGDLYQLNKGSSSADAIYVSQSTDGGESWTSYQEGLRQVTVGYDLLITQDGDRYVAAGGSSVYKLSSGASFWLPVNVGEGKLLIRDLEVLSDGRLLADADGGLYTSSVPVTSSAGGHPPTLLASIEVRYIDAGRYEFHGIPHEPEMRTVSITGIRGVTERLDESRIIFNDTWLALDLSHLGSGFYVVSLLGASGIPVSVALIITD